jgi:hypothetical protein
MWSAGQPQAVRRIASTAPRRARSAKSVVEKSVSSMSKKIAFRLMGR